jgi:hypothetical protein
VEPCAGDCEWGSSADPSEHFVDTCAPRRARIYDSATSKIHRLLPPSFDALSVASADRGGDVPAQLRHRFPLDSGRPPAD